MSAALFVAVAVLLSLERLFYVWVWRHPEAFSALCRRPALRFPGTPVDGVQRFFFVFKVIQIGVFVGWCVYFGDVTIGPAWPMAAGFVLILAGQVLNVSVFCRLGKVGVYYGVRFGHEVPWCRGFPFSLLKHPQYVGAVMSIWGFFPHHAVSARRLVRPTGTGNRVLRIGGVLRAVSGRPACVPPLPHPHPALSQRERVKTTAQSSLITHAFFTVS